MLTSRTSVSWSGYAYSSPRSQSSSAFCLHWPFCDIGRLQRTSGFRKEDYKYPANRGRPSDHQVCRRTWSQSSHPHVSSRASRWKEEREILTEARRSRVGEIAGKERYLHGRLRGQRGWRNCQQSQEWPGHPTWESQIPCRGRGKQQRCRWKKGQSRQRESRRV